MALSYEMIGSRINHHRKAQQLTVEALAERSLISVQHMSHICNGRTRLSLTCLVNICNALNISPNDILLDDINSGTEIQLKQDIQRVFEDCTNIETKHMLTIASALKQSLRISSKQINNP